MFCQVRDFVVFKHFYAPVEIHCATKQNCLRDGLNILYRASQRSADHIINDDLKISTAHHIKEVLFFLDVRCKIENKLNPIFGSLSKKYRLPMSSPVGVQWLYWTGIEGCKRGATITYHNHDLYTSRIPGAFIIVHVKKAASVYFCLALDRLGCATNKPTKWNEISPRCKNAMPSANESYCWSVC